MIRSKITIGPFQSCGVSGFVIRSEMEKRKYSSFVAGCKPPLSHHNKIIRKQWAKDQLHWTKKDWEKMIWTDESWITNG